MGRTIPVLHVSRETVPASNAPSWPTAFPEYVNPASFSIGQRGSNRKGMAIFRIHYTEIVRSNDRTGVVWVLQSNTRAVCFRLRVPDAPERNEAR